jgi:hypothetical protein
MSPLLCLEETFQAEYADRIKGKDGSIWQDAVGLCQVTESPAVGQQIWSRVEGLQVPRVSFPSTRDYSSNTWLQECITQTLTSRAIRSLSRYQAWLSEEKQVEYWASFARVWNKLSGEPGTLDTLCDEAVICISMWLIPPCMIRLLEILQAMVRQGDLFLPIHHHMYAWLDSLIDQLDQTCNNPDNYPELPSIDWMKPFLESDKEEEKEDPPLQESESSVSAPTPSASYKTIEYKSWLKAGLLLWKAFSASE